MSEMFVTTAEASDLVSQGRVADLYKRLIQAGGRRGRIVGGGNGIPGEGYPGASMAESLAEENEAWRLYRKATSGRA